jgi:hypothetical protein
MNINALKDSDALLPGFYIAGYGGKGWPGGVLYCSKDGGASYNQSILLTSGATMGTVSGTMADSPCGLDQVDTQTKVTVVLGYDTGRLAGVTYEQMLLGLNVAIIGSEIVFFKNAVLTGLRTYELSGFLRGRRGSEGFRSTHAASEKFVLYEPGAVKFVPMETADIGVEYLWKAVSMGGQIAEATASPFTYQGANLKPYAGVDAIGKRDASSNLTIVWTRRNRTNGEWRDGVEVPMTEASEAYEVDIYSDNTFTTVLRTLTNATPSVLYSAANQTTDFGSPQSTVYCKIYQMSALIGRGYELKGTL